jgi:hypothetical protein
MKKLFLAMLVCIALTAAAPVYAQTISKEHESEYFYTTIPVERIYPYRKGYIVQYRKGVNEMARVYLPQEWFTDTGGKGELVTLPKGKNWPYLVVYYKEGEFSHLRLYVHWLKNHETWGHVPQNVNIDDRFENVDTIKLEF